MKKQSGISLVALIITIIVMVILAGIIIVSAVADGGIIDRVQGAAKEHERAEIEDLVIASYVYKETASQGNNYAVLDLDQTAEAIYKNLTDNGFTIKGKDGEASEKVEDFYDKGSGDNIEIEAEGNHGSYIGEVDKNGLIEGIKPKDEDDDDGEIKNDFEIEVRQSHNTTSVNIYIEPKSIENLITEESEAVTLFANYINKMTGRTDVKTFEDVNLAIYGLNAGSEAKTYSSYTEFVADMAVVMNKTNPSNQEIFVYIMGGSTEDGMTIQYTASMMYTMLAEPQTLKINGKDVSEDATWYSDQINYTIRENGTHKIELNLGGKIATAEIEVTGISDFQITVDQQNNTNSMALTIKPTITEVMFAEKDAVKVVAKNISGAENCTTLEELDVVLYNQKYGTNLTEYEEVAEEMITKMGVSSKPTKQEIFKYFMYNYSVEYWATALFKPENKKLIINGEEITEGVTWDGNNASYTVYQNGAYEIELELDEKKGSKNIELTGIYNNLGKYVKYDDGYDSNGDGKTDDELYRIIYDEEELGQGKGAQIVSTHVLEAEKISIRDEVDETKVTDVNGDKDLELEKAIYAYNNIVEILNSKCQNLVNKQNGIATEIRSLGTNPIDLNEDTSSMFYFSYSDTSNAEWARYIEGKLKVASEKTRDTERLKFLNITYSDVSLIPWRYISESSTQVSYYLMTWDSTGAASLAGLGDHIYGHKNFSSASVGETNLYGIVPIISLENGILKNATGSGTDKDPYILKPVN